MEFQNEGKNQCTTIGRRELRLQYLRRALALLLSASLFSIILCFFSELSFLHSYTYYLLTFLLPVFTQILERKCMFLLCNGILVFLAGKSGLCSASGRHQEAEYADMRERTTLDEAVASVTYTLPQVMLARDEEHELLNSAQLDGEEAAAKYQAGMAERSDQAEDEAREHDTENEDCGFLVGGGIDTDTEEHSSNSEELNKKIEEFIRKMKEELRLEAQQQPLIAA